MISSSSVPPVAGNASVRPATDGPAYEEGRLISRLQEARRAMLKAEAALRKLDRDGSNTQPPDARSALQDQALERRRAVREREYELLAYRKNIPKTAADTQGDPARSWLYRRSFERLFPEDARAIKSLQVYNAQGRLAVLPFAESSSRLDVYV